MLRKGLAAAGSFTAAAFIPGPAAAHAPVPGIEGFYTGLLHPFTTPGQLLSVLALGLLLGLKLRKRLPVIAALVVGLLAGMVAGQFDVRPAWAETALLLATVMAAGIGALAPPDRVWPVLAVAAAVTAGLAGFFLGLVSTPDPGPVRAVVITLSGSFVSVVLVSLYIGAVVAWLRERFARQWMQVGIRIIAAWIGAVAILMAALSFAKV